MFTIRSILLIVVALITAGSTAMLARSWLHHRSDAPSSEVHRAPEEPVTRVLVAGKDLATGTLLKPGDVVWQTWPKEGVHEAFLIEGKDSEKDLEGAVVRSRMFKGEPVQKARVVQPGDQGFLAATLAPGKRAVSVPVEGVTGVAGFVFPGDLVDVILSVKQTVTVEDEGSAARVFSETLLSGIRVLAIDQVTDQAPGQAKVAKTVTLEVTAKQAEKITAGLELGSLSLSLRGIAQEAALGQSDTDAGKARSYTRDTDVLFMIGDPLGLPQPPGARQKINVLHGSKVEELRF
jgi:pilus assembly protein CpaB